MSQWKNDDSAANSVLWGAAQFHRAANSLNRTALFGNTTVNAFGSGFTVGQFGVDTTEMGVSNGSIVLYQVISPGTGYFANATVTVGSNSTMANATANATGYINSVNIVAAGNNFTSNPIVTIAAPAAQAFNANSAVDSTLDFITISSNKFQSGDRITYFTAAGNTVLTNLTNNASYFINSANSTGVKLSSAADGSAIDLTKGLTESGHFLQGQTATAAAVISGASGKGFHAGWVLRRVGTGGRAGRVQYETLVAMGSMTGDSLDDTIFKDT